MFSLTLSVSAIGKQLVHENEKKLAGGVSGGGHVVDDTYLISALVKDFITSYDLELSEKEVGDLADDFKVLSFKERKLLLEELHHINEAL